jgi:small-conductance mechanosensitive channel
MRRIFLYLAGLALMASPSAIGAQQTEDEPTTSGIRAVIKSNSNAQLPSAVIPASWQKLWETKLIGGNLTEISYGDLLESAIILLLFCLAIGVGRIVVSKILAPRLEKRNQIHPTLANEQILLALRTTKSTPFFLLAILMAAAAIPLPGWIRYVFRIAVVAAFTYQFLVWGEALLSNWIAYTRKRRIEADPSSVTALGTLSFFGRIGLWSMVLLLAIYMLGLSGYLTPILAGVGIGGIAIAFALQNILSDIFCSIAILLDKPFVVGDFIIAGEQMGVVESIGIKTTRVRSLSGEQIIFPNADLIGSRIRNFKRMFERRVLFAIGVTYDTPPEKLKLIPGIIRDAITREDKTRFDRAHFARFGASSLDFESVYYVQDPSYNVYMDIHQSINLTLIERFAAEGVEFAFPTQTLHVFSEESEGANAGPSQAALLK